MRYLTAVFLVRNKNQGHPPHLPRCNGEFANCRYVGMPSCLTPASRQARQLEAEMLLTKSESVP